ncbi:MAG TPA: lysophospholipase [Thermotogota bacterium]|nr:lysophospholipase [Thermotogota bacterium]HPJ89697.1 lysophospholipase [Thermotogota bacterium]HPR97361.1 lysophospholipase [Thermotogota bacterium]
MKNQEYLKIGGKKTYTVNYPNQDALAVILFVHGLGEHIDRYERFAVEMRTHRFAIYGFDNFGHGKTKGIRGNTSVEDSFKIIDYMVQKIRRENPKLPIGIFGHSLGGLITLRYLEDHSDIFYAAVVSSPAIVVDEETRKKMEKNASIAKLIPFITLNNAIRQEDISRNRNEVIEYSRDTLVHPRVSLKLALSIHNNVKKVKDNASSIMTPIMFQKGTGDHVVPLEGTDEFFGAIGSEKKILCKYNDAFHETIYDPEHGEQFRQDIIGWFRSNI